MQIGYTLPQSFVKKIALQKVRFYLSGENLFTITGRFPKSLDPETANVGGRGMVSHTRLCKCLPLAWIYNFN